MKYLTDFEVTDKKVLVRCDFNVPINETGDILDDFRIQKTLPTIQYLLKHKAKIILMSHLGEPEGKIISTLTLDKVKVRLEELLGVVVQKTNDCVGVEVTQIVSSIKSDQIVLLENVRFHQEETENDAVFAKELATLGEIYINDAFSDCHRAHASIVGICQYLPSGAGLLLQSEVENLNKILEKPKKPLVVLVGGKKVATKQAFIEKILKVADIVLVSGLIKKEILASSLRAAAWQSSEKIVGPIDNLEAEDISQETIALFGEKIVQAKTIVWNGPFGKFEDDRFKKGTLAIANAIIKSGAFSVVGGGETVEFLHKEGMIGKFSHVSTGGGAMLEYLSGQDLPGLKALE